MNYVVLKSVLLAGHPSTGTYDADSSIAAGQINLANIERNKTSMSGRAIAAEIVNSEYDAMTGEKKLQILSIISSADVDPFGFAANVVKDVFGSGSDTLTALAAARVETVSDATVNNLGTVKPGHIEIARGI